MSPGGRGGVSTPMQSLGYLHPVEGDEDYLHPVLMGVPQFSLGVLHPDPMGVPQPVHMVGGRGVPHADLAGVSPISGWSPTYLLNRITHTGSVTSKAARNYQYPSQVCMGYPSPSRDVYSLPVQM